MSDQPIHVVTGAYGYSGRAIAERLLAKDYSVRTLTNSLDRSNRFGDRVTAYPFNFENPGELAASLKGAAVLYNTYWVRFNHWWFRWSQEEAVANSLRLFECAKEAGVERVVHISIMNPSEDSPLQYFRLKAEIEKGLKSCGLSYAILRPAVLFGREDVLINNIAWMLRHLPVIGIFGKGDYRLQPIHVDDLARIAVDEGEKREDTVINASGPETFQYKALVKTIAEIIGQRRPIVSVPPFLGYLAGKMLGLVMRDKVLTWEEVKGLISERLYADSPPAGTTMLTDWARENADQLGRQYASELARRRKARGKEG